MSSIDRFPWARAARAVRIPRAAHGVRGVRRPAGRALRVALLAAGALAGIAACEHPIAVVSPHVEAQDLLVRDTTGRLLLRTQDNTTWSAPTLEIPLDDSLPVMVRLVDFRGTEFDLSDRSREYSIRVQAENAAAVQWEPRRTMGWLRGFVAGPTRVRFQVWHTDHPDFISPWLTVQVVRRTP